MLTRRATLVTLFAAIASPALANRPEIFKSNAGVAVNGYDVTAYFNQNRHVQGQPSFSAEWMGATWLFASAESRTLFIENPTAYAPQYGGHCAFAASKNALASTVPEAWTIHNNRLYLNFSLGVREIWRQDIPSNIALADGFWPALHG